MTRRPRRRGAGPPASKRRPAHFALAPAVLAAVAIAGGWLYLGPGPGAQGQSTDVVLPSGVGLSGIARTLARAGVIRAPAGFMLAATVTGAARRLKAGEYAFRSGESLAEVVSAIAGGEVVRRFVTVPEGFTSQAVVDVLRRADYLAGPAPVPAEGALLPDTYEVSRGETRIDVLNRMAEARDRLLDRLWDDRAPDLPYQSKEQAVILASVVEKETSLAQERPKIAAVFINRLKKGMRLESDPTVIYGVSGGVPLGHGLRASELAAPTPYNTYLVGGLPPTPIANPGRAALVAALAPAQTGDLYFVADGTGGHVFSDTLEAHRRNVARWRAIERARREAPAA